MAEGTDHQHGTTAGAGSTQLRTVLVCDLADSTALVERLGDRQAAELFRRHDRIARDLLKQHGGREIDKTDGFLALFERPIQAVAFAVAYQRALREQDASADASQPLRARVGIHVGEVRVWDNAADDIALGAKQVEVEGLAKPVAARLMSLALPGQILLSGVAHTLAQRAQDELGEVAPRVRWLTHGRYRFKGVPQPMVVHEAGEAGVAPLKAPPSGSKVRRELPWYRTPVALSMELLLVLAVVAGSLWAVLRPDPAIAFAERDWVVVGDLRNLTSEPLFDDALDAAFRIGLEQSRYVNVLPELQVRDTLRRMQRDPQAVLDRETAIEIALREGARAVILPTITEVGGRVRVSAEVVDPNSAVTVYGESADGAGAEAALPAMDQVLVSLRSRLGESLTAIEQGAAPLARITTASLDALRAFAVAEQKLAEGAVLEAIALLEQAVAIDPAFAMAHSRMATIRHAMGDSAAAHAAAARGLAQADKLSTRERLLLEGVMAFLAAPGEARERWSTLLDLYPDIAVAENNIGLAYYWIENDYRNARTHFQRFADSNSPFRGYGGFGVAMTQLALGDAAAAADSMAQARAGSLNPPAFEHVLPPLALGQHEQARALVSDEQQDWGPAARVERALRLAAIALDAGQATAARTTLDAVAADLPEGVPASIRRRLSFQQVVLGVLDATADGKAALRRFIREEVGRLPEAERQHDRSASLHLVLAAALASGHGEPTLAAEALEATRPFVLDRSVPHIEALWRTSACAMGAPPPGEQVACLERLLGERSYVLTHAALLRAAEAAGVESVADRERAWLAAHRGQALAEMQHTVPILLNIAALQDAERPAATATRATPPAG